MNAHWRADALCAEVGLDLFYPEVGESTAAAKAVCARCTVRPECAQYALDHGERFGIWGGMSVPDRQIGRTAADQTQTRDERVAELRAQKAASARRYKASVKARAT